MADDPKLALDIARMAYDASLKGAIIGGGLTFLTALVTIPLSNWLQHRQKKKDKGYEFHMSRHDKLIELKVAIHETARLTESLFAQGLLIDNISELIAKGANLDSELVDEHGKWRVLYDRYKDSLISISTVAERYGLLYDYVQPQMIQSFSSIVRIGIDQATRPVAKRIITDDDGVREQMDRLSEVIQDIYKIQRIEYGIARTFLEKHPKDGKPLVANLLFLPKYDISIDEQNRLLNRAPESPAQSR